MSSIDKEIARDITVAWINCGKLSEEYLTKKQVAAFYECIFQTVAEAKIMPKGISQDVGTPTPTTSTAAVTRSSTSMGSSMSRHRYP